MLNKVVISLGSNTPDSNGRMMQAMMWLEENLISFKCSAIYSTPPLSGVGSDYLNAVAVGEIKCEQNEFNLMLKDYEKFSGRTPEAKKTGVVPIDLDIVIFNDQIVRPKDYSYDFFQIGYRQIVLD